MRILTVVVLFALIAVSAAYLFGSREDDCGGGSTKEDGDTLDEKCDDLCVDNEIGCCVSSPDSPNDYFCVCCKEQHGGKAPQTEAGACNGYDNSGGKRDHCYEPTSGPRNSTGGVRKQ